MISKRSLGDRSFILGAIRHFSDRLNDENKFVISIKSDIQPKLSTGNLPSALQSGPSGRHYSSKENSPFGSPIATKSASNYRSSPIIKNERFLIMITHVRQNC
jgi:hypothetical protein